MPRWETIRYYPVPTDADATESAARAEAAEMLRSGHRRIYLCMSTYKNSGASIGSRWFVLDERTLARIPAAARYIREALTA